MSNVAYPGNFRSPNSYLCQSRRVLDQNGMPPCAIANPYISIVSNDEEGMCKGPVPRKAQVISPIVKNCMGKYNQRISLVIRHTEQEMTESWSEKLKEPVRLTRPTRMSQSSASYRILAIRRAWNLKATAMQAIVRQTTFTVMMLGTMLSEMCNICSSISAGVGMVAMLSDLGIPFHYVEGAIVSRGTKQRMMV